MTNVLDMIDNGSMDIPIFKMTARKWKRFGKRPSYVFKLSAFPIQIKIKSVFLVDQKVNLFENQY